MSRRYDGIYADVKKLAAVHGTTDPRVILEEREVVLLPFKGKTKLLGMYTIIEGSRFVFYNPDANRAWQRMVFAHELGHDMYHREYAAAGGIIEYNLFALTNDTEVEANIFAAHLLLADEAVAEYIREGLTYAQIAAALRVNVNLLLCKLNEMYRRGYPIRRQDPADNRFFSKVDADNYS